MMYKLNAAFYDKHHLKWRHDVGIMPYEQSLIAAGRRVR